MERGEERRGKSEYEWEAWWTELILLWQCSDHWTEEDSTPPLHRGNLALLHMHKQQQQLLLSSLSRRQHQHERASSPLPSTATGSGLSESSTKQHAAQHHHSPITRSKLWKVTVQRKGSGRGNIELMKREPRRSRKGRGQCSGERNEWTRIVRDTVILYMNFSKIVFTYMLDILPTLLYFMPFSGTYYCIMHFMIFIWIVSSLIQHYLQKRLTLGINHGSNVAVAHFQDSQYWCDHTQQQQHQRVHRSHPRP